VSRRDRQPEQILHSKAGQAPGATWLPAAHLSPDASPAGVPLTHLGICPEFQVGESPCSPQFSSPSQYTIFSVKLNTTWTSALVCRRGDTNQVLEAELENAASEEPEEFRARHLGPSLPSGKRRELQVCRCL